MANAKQPETEKPAEEKAVALIPNTGTVPEYRNSDLQEITTFEDALALMRETYGDDGVMTADEVIGNGFAMLGNKDQLIGVPFIVLKWQFYPGKFANNFVSAMVVTSRNQKFLLTDGSKNGICAQLAEVAETTGKQGGLVVRNGLVRSDYEYEDSDGEMRPASTYYINTAATV